MAAMQVVCETPEKEVICITRRAALVKEKAIYLEVATTLLAHHHNHARPEASALELVNDFIEFAGGKAAITTAMQLEEAQVIAGTHFGYRNQPVRCNVMWRAVE